MPAKAGIQLQAILLLRAFWIPACAGMTAGQRMPLFFADRLC
jgi:hypothetical protein